MTDCNYDWKQDPLMPKPEILHAPPPRAVKSPNDVTDFPAQAIVDIPEEFNYPEGKYRPPSIPYRGGFIPIKMYLEQGKVYRWCSCGASWSEPFCDHKCHYQITRNRPIVFNVDQSGYYKLCNCKQSANAPFCNGTHQLLVKQFTKTHFGFYRTVTAASIAVSLGIVWWNFRY
jgi:CDGSH iron-sulfur domain-containing protein 3